MIGYDEKVFLVVIKDKNFDSQDARFLARVLSPYLDDPVLVIPLNYGNAFSYSRIKEKIIFKDKPKK
jgi:hypothetical protein